MKVTRWFGLITAFVLLFAVNGPSNVNAEEMKTLEDESIYDLLVDRFFNGDSTNDENIDIKDLSAFYGGDFAGIVDRLSYIGDMGFTIISLGPIFHTETYDGSQVLNYNKLEPHFGSDVDLEKMIESIHQKKMSVIADFPFSGVSPNHIWIKEGMFTGIPTEDGTIDWDSSDSLVKEALKNAVISFAEKHDLDGIRLTKIGNFDEAYMNEVIAAVKQVKPEMYVFTNEQHAADFDAIPNIEKMAALKQSFVEFDPDSSPLSLFEDKAETDFIQFDELTGPRFTFEMVEKRMFPPTRWKLAAAALFTLPGIPVMTYETEIAVTGEKAPVSHPVTNFKTDMALTEFITDLNKLRNQSEALRNGDFELLYNDQGFTVYKRSNDKETWIVALNNRTVTSNIELPKEVVGENKKLRGVLDGDLVRESKDGTFRIVLEREVAEIYIADEDKGFNTPYLIASILVFTLFFIFIFAVLRRGKKGVKKEVK